MSHDIRPGAAVRLSHTGKMIGIVSKPDGRTFAVDISGITFWVPISAIQRLEEGEVILDPARLSRDLLDACSG